MIYGPANCPSLKAVDWWASRARPYYDPPAAPVGGTELLRATRQIRDELKVYGWHRIRAPSHHDVLANNKQIEHRRCEHGNQPPPATASRDNHTEKAGVRVCKIHPVFRRETRELRKIQSKLAVRLWFEYVVRGGALIDFGQADLPLDRPAGVQPARARRPDCDFAPAAQAQ